MELEGIEFSLMDLVHLLAVVEQRFDTPYSLVLHKILRLDHPLHLFLGVQVALLILEVTDHLLVVIQAKEHSVLDVNFLHDSRLAAGAV